MESRIDATTRLRHEGRWAAASKEREQKRQELRTQGLSRKVANQQAWEWMIAEYPPKTVDDDDEDIEVNAAFFAAMASYPPLHSMVDAEGEPLMEDYWWVYCFLRAMLFDATDGVPGTRFLSLMVRDAPSSEARRLSLVAWHNPVGFCSLAYAKFEAVVQRLSVAVAPDDEYLEEIEYHMEACEQLMCELQHEQLELIGQSTG